MAQTRFSPTTEIPFRSISLAPEYFQGRQSDYSQDTVKAIVNKGFYDKTGEPIIVWQEDTDKHIVISGHSRYEAIRQLFTSGKQPDLNNVPVKIFLGDKDEAIDYAVLESNRGSTEEGLISDLKAYRRAVERGKNRTYLLTVFKPESRLNKLQQLAYLNPKGQFVENLAGTSALSFPYLERNSTWVGNMRKQLPQLTNAHETEIFNYIYKGKGLSLKKDKLFDLVSKKVNRIDFDADKALNLADRVSTNALTDPLQEQIKDLDKQITRANKEIESKRASIVRARQTKTGSEQIPKLQARITELNTYILRMIEQRETVRQKVGKVERTQTQDLFSAPAPVEKPRDKEAENRKFREEQKKLPWYERVSALPTRKYFMSDQKVPDEKYAEWTKPLVIPKDLVKEFDQLQKQAYQGWQGVSFSPEKRGRSFLKDTLTQLEDFTKEVAEATRVSGTEKINQALVSDFRKQYMSKALEYAYAQGNTISSMITGPAKFPTRRAERANDRVDRVYGELRYLPKKFIKRADRERKRKSREKMAESGAFKPENQLKQAKADLAAIEYEQNRVSKANRLITKWLKTGDTDVTAFALAELGYDSEFAVKAMANRKGYNRKIGSRYGMYASRKKASIKERIADLENKIEKGPIPEKVEFEGGYKYINRTEDRLQLIFDDKPSDEIRTGLKRNGFRWSPRFTAWQRQLTLNAEKSFDRLVEDGLVKLVQKSATESKPVQKTANESKPKQISDIEWAQVPKMVRTYLAFNFPKDKVSVRRKTDRGGARNWKYLEILSVKGDGDIPLTEKLQQFLYLASGSPRTIDNNTTGGYGGLLYRPLVYQYLLPLMEKYPMWFKYREPIVIPWKKSAGIPKPTLSPAKSKAIPDFKKSKLRLMQMRARALKLKLKLDQAA